MTALLNNETQFLCSVEHDIYANPSWLGHISGLKADKMLRSFRHKPYLYVLRQGEEQGNYYVTYVKPDGTIFHQPFTILMSDIGWCWENNGTGALPPRAKLDDILYLIMHCEKGECHPLEC